MLASRYFHTSTTVGSIVVLAGGENSGGDLISAEIYTISTGTFGSAGTMTTARQGHSATMLANGLLIVGGYNNNIPLATAEFAAAQSAAY
jgi:hypothetical protein